MDRAENVVVMKSLNAQQAAVRSIEWLDLGVSIVSSFVSPKCPDDIQRDEREWEKIRNKAIKQIWPDPVDYP